MKCNFCERHCDLSEEKFGFCRMYYSKNNEIKERFPDKWSSVSVSRVESVPFYHAYPGAKSLVIGTSGCNFRCRYCSNGFLACEPPEDVQGQMFHLTGDEIVKTALKMNCHNIIFNVNEPAVSLLSLQQVSEAAKRECVPMGCLTNGFTSEASTEIMASVFQFMNISLKGFSSKFYRDYAGVKSVDPVLRNIRTLAGKSHIEITTPIIQGVNDHEIDAIADFIADVDPEIPWHVFRLLPEHDMIESDYPKIDEINAQLETARKKLPYLYFHNFVGSDWVNTICPSCGDNVIERFSLGCGGDKLDRYLCDNARCSRCGQSIKMQGSNIPWNHREAV